METTSSRALRPHVRWLICRDLPEVLQIERQSSVSPWTEEEFRKCMRLRYCIGMVAEHDERVVGYMLYELHKAKLHVLNFAVDPAYRRRGVGQALVARLASKLSSQRRTRVTLMVRDGNLPGQLFFRACGYRARRVLRGYYDNGDDGYLMVYRHGA